MIQARASELDEVRDDAAEQHLALRRELATSAQDLARLGSALAEEGARAEMAEELHAQAQADVARLTDSLAAAEGACVAPLSAARPFAAGRDPRCAGLLPKTPGHPLRRPAPALRA